ncbi:hypothetical protein [Mongoliitalea daihaiensis]|uniref:hypothetical protein n=1 Tax=Mongoliitalea daihaiensis TaxID=2782006 RepID=UPI001F397292|nr:hypothetical protein [Mongoliitalea daihaiensis]UJP63667.1 hypothetical protein IPZ59_12565 [Mongoliitalea daihaiensis]
MEITALRNIYAKLERNTLILIAVPLPFFGFAYLYTQSPIMELNLPAENSFWGGFSLTFLITLLAGHYIAFHSNLGKAKNPSLDITQKVQIYAKATMIRFWFLFGIAMWGSFALMITQNPLFTIILALNLIFFSLGKPTPDRIVRLLKLKGEERQQVEELKKRI